MRCLGRTKSFKRCKNPCKFIACKQHYWQIVLFFLITIPTLLLTYYEIVKNIREDFLENEIPIEEYIEDQKRQDSLVSSNLEEIYKAVIPESQEVDQNKSDLYNAVIDIYEGQNHINLDSAIYKAFDVEVQNKYESMGYVVAAYFGLRNYKDATKTVLERDRNLPSYNHRLKLDVIKCLRNSYLKDGFETTSKFIDEFKMEYGNKILSDIFCFIPQGIAHKIESSIHSRFTLDWALNETSEAQLEAIIDDSDPYCSYGYYLLKDFEKAIECNPESRIMDILLFAAGYEKIRQFYISQNENFTIRLISHLSNKSINNQQKKILEKAIEYFKQYVDNDDYLELPHYDDAKFWMAWAHAHLGQVDPCLTLLQSIKEGDFADYKLAFEPLLIPRFGNSLKMSDYDYILQNVITDSGYTWDTRKFRTAISKLDNNSIIGILKNYGKKAQHGINWFIRKKLDNGSFNIQTHELCKALLDTDDELTEELDQTIRLGEQYWRMKTTNDVDEYIKLHIKLYQNILIHSLYADLSSGVKRFEKSDRLDYLYYLLIRRAVHSAPDRVDLLVDNFQQKFPNSKYVDDVLAEAIYVSLENHRDVNKALNYFNIISLEHNDKNAVDNSIFHLANYYDGRCCTSYFKRENCEYDCKMAEKYSSMIVRLYPESTYRSKSSVILKNAEKMQSEE